MFRVKGYERHTLQVGCRAEQSRVARLDGEIVRLLKDRVCRHKEQLAREKEKRVEHLCGTVAKRIMKKDLARGWTAWHEKWAEEARRKRMLAAATSRLKNPGLPRCFRSSSSPMPTI